MSFKHMHGGIPCQADGCALPHDSIGAAQEDMTPEFLQKLEKLQEEVIDPLVEAAEKESFNNVLNMLAEEFDQAMITRHDMGREKYGPGKFLVVDTLEEAIAEIVDLANYAKYSYIKIRLLQEYFVQQGVPDQIPTSGFVKAADMTAIKETKR